MLHLWNCVSKRCHELYFCVLRPQVVEDGYEFFAKRQLVTLFSAPNYCGEFDNAGGMMSVDETLMCSFQVRGPLKVPKKFLQCKKRLLQMDLNVSVCVFPDPEAVWEESKVPVRRDELGPARHSTANSPNSKETMKDKRSGRVLS